MVYTSLFPVYNRRRQGRLTSEVGAKHMTVLELIEQLNTMPPEAIIVLQGYEDGVNEADALVLYYE
jgi:hypothetical protein